MSVNVDIPNALRLSATWPESSAPSDYAVLAQRSAAAQEMAQKQRGRASDVQPDAVSISNEHRSETEQGARQARGVADRVAAQIEAKFLAGQREHGGNVYEKAGMLGHAEDEAHDLSVYHDVLRQQLTEIRGQAADLLAALDKVLGTPEP